MLKEGSLGIVKTEKNSKKISAQKSMQKNFLTKKISLIFLVGDKLSHLGQNLGQFVPAWDKFVPDLGQIVLDLGQIVPDPGQICPKLGQIVPDFVPGGTICPRLKK